MTAHDRFGLIGRCALSHNGYGCKLGAGHEGDVHRGADGHEWRTEESWGWAP